MVGVRGEARVLLNDDEKRMYAGDHGPAVQKGMDLLVRYGEALGAERLVETQNVCGANVFTPRRRALGGDSEDAAFSPLSLDSDEIVEMPQVKVFSCQLIGPMDREEWTTQGVSDDAHAEMTESMDHSARHGVHLMNTCTPKAFRRRVRSTA
jgi:predicted aconitase